MLALLGGMGFVITAVFCSVVWFETEVIVSTVLTGLLGLMATSMMWKYSEKCRDADAELRRVKAEEKEMKNNHAEEIKALKDECVQ